MSKITVTKADGTEEEFTETIGHQIGNGAVQIMMNDGTQVIFNNFKEVFIDLDEDEKASFKERIVEAEAAAQAKLENMKELTNPASDDTKNRPAVVPLNS